MDKRCALISGKGCMYSWFDR